MDLPPPIDIYDILGLLYNSLGSKIGSILISCGPGCRTKLFQKEYDAKMGEIIAPNILLSHLKMKYLTAITRRPPEMQQLVTDTFTTLPPSETLGEIPQSVRVNAANASSSNLRRIADISKLDSGKSSVVLDKIENTMVRLDYMSKEERQKVFDDVQKVVLLSIITALVKKKQAIGADIGELRRIETEIYNNTHSLHIMYSLIHEYILHMYHAAPTPITTSADLLQFIKDQLPVLSASMSPYYQGEKDIIDFKIYLPLLANYIELVLKENYPVSVAKNNSIEVAKLIMRIIEERICAFVQVAGDPDICIRHTIVHNATNFIIEGVRKFLSGYTPPTPDRPPSKKRRIWEGGNHSRIKKYKNRTKYRTKRRTKYRTKRGTKYRTNQYKIKNKKTRKVYKY